MKRKKRNGGERICEYILSFSLSLGFNTSVLAGIVFFYISAVLELTKDTTWARLVVLGV